MTTERAINPFIRHMYTADPSAHVWDDGRLYVYPSTDVAPARGCDRMDGYHVFSTDDMVNWVDHGEILHSRDVPWGRPEGGFMWAPDCAYKDGVYYYYFPHPSESNRHTSWKTGVATSTSPTSGFELQGYIEGLNPLIDPCVFIDDDGAAYLYIGGAQPGHPCEGGKLADNMMEVDGEMEPMVGLDEFHEGAWVFRRNDTYYLVYPDHHKGRGNKMRYAMSDKPLGPWQYKGVFIEPTGCYTMHGSVVEYKKQWYVFYHNCVLSTRGNLRSICFDTLHFNDDGTFQTMEQTGSVDVVADCPVIYNADGKPLPLPIGEYRASGFPEMEVEPGTVCSMSIPTGYTVEFFEEDGFTGAKQVVSATGDLPSGGFTTASFKIAFEAEENQTWPYHAPMETVLVENMTVGA